MNTWTEQELALLTEKYPHFSLSELAQLLPGRSCKAIKSRAGILHLKKAIPRIRLTSSQIEEIKRDYATTLNQNLADRYGCSVHSINSIGSRKHLQKDPEFLKSVFREKFMNPAHPARAFIIQKGSVPKNKGKKQSEYLSPEAIEKISQTSFKKGNLPHNTLHDYAITLRKDKNGHTYQWIRVAKGKWILLHRYTYEQHHGKIGKGINIQFRDGDHLNCDINNLYAIKRNEQILENSGAINLPDAMIASYLAGKKRPDLKEEFQKHPQLLDLKRKQLIINRKIKEYGKENGKA